MRLRLESDMLEVSMDHTARHLSKKQKLIHLLWEIDRSTLQSEASPSAGIPDLTPSHLLKNILWTSMEAQGCNPSTEGGGQEDQEFKASLNYLRSYLKKAKDIKCSERFEYT